MKQELGVHAGLSCDGTTMTLTWRDGERWTSLDASCVGDPGVGGALTGLLSAAPPLASLRVTLLRPLATARTLPMPDMPTDDAERVLARDWARHVVGFTSGAHVATARRVDRGRWAAAFAPVDAVESITLALDEGVSSTVEFRTTDDTLAGAARALAPEESRGGDLVVVVCDALGPTDAIHLRAGVPWVGRRFPEGATDTDVLAFARNGIPSGTTVIVLGGGHRATALSHALGTAGIRTRVVATGLPADSSSDATIAALGTLSPSILPLLGRGARANVAQRARHITRWLMAATLLALLGAYGIERWRMSAELRAVTGQRAELGSAVQAAIALRTDVDHAIAAVATIAAQEARASRSGSLLAHVTLGLPAHASLTSFSLSGDSVTVEGESRRGADVYEALRTVPGIAQVRLAAPLRQERLAGDSGVTVERFAFSALLHGAARGATQP